MIIRSQDAGKNHRLAAITVPSKLAEGLPFLNA
jgi:hypothetical protein